MKKIIRILIIIIVLFLSYSYLIEPRLLVIKRIDIKTNFDINDLKIVFFTDTHFGKYYNQSNLEKIVDAINSEAPDVVIFGGDFFDNYIRDSDNLDSDYITSELQKINTVYGKFAVMGNHDYGGGALKIYEQLMENSGFTLLKNENMIIKDLKITGYDDYLLGQTESSGYSIAYDGMYNIIVTNEPITANSVTSNSENLILSGHTHGGQVTIPFLTDKIMPKGSGEYVKGIYNLGNSTLFVSSGIGMTILPFRFLNPPEIAVININP